jgi:hypothetical protein
MNEENLCFGISLEKPETPTPVFQVNGLWVTAYTVGKTPWAVADHCQRESLPPPVFVKWETVKIFKKPEIRKFEGESRRWDEYEVYGKTIAEATLLGEQFTRKFDVQFCWGLERDGYREPHCGFPMVTELAD